MSRRSMMVRHVGEILYGVAFVVVLLLSLAQAGDVKEKAALIAAEKWLGLVDAGNYAESWEESASTYKSRVTKEQWQQALQRAHQNLGKIISRKVKSMINQSSMPGAPDEELIVVQFETSYENAKSAIETVTPMFEKDGRWRVSGYSITPSAPGRRSILTALLLFFVLIAAWSIELNPKPSQFKKDN